MQTWLMPPSPLTPWGPAWVRPQLELTGSDGWVGGHQPVSFWDRHPQWAVGPSSSAPLLPWPLSSPLVHAPAPAFGAGFPPHTVLPDCCCQDSHSLAGSKSQGMPMEPQEGAREQCRSLAETLRPGRSLKPPWGGWMGIGRPGATGTLEDLRFIQNEAEALKQPFQRSSQDIQ